ncbi:thioesterase family protein [Chitinimonas viridis]|uniref:Thioesterase family protein n=1 Tax=Chitinimonas viridis TaxID=664880 RepID=A0ABT8AZC2_9NEIS|nr:thioesterase family protein [Chitinimonas viridis]MDN3575164.1 thioesterase family protein [Chitinimonas viridis]
MARVKLDLPEHFPYSTLIEIGIGHINYGGHLGNDSALTLAHEARLRFLRSLGFSELDIAGYGLIQTDAVLVYKNQAFWGETLVAEVTADEFSKYGCDLYYRFRQQSDGREVLHAKTGVVFFDYQNKKLAAVPAEFLNALGHPVPAV